MIHADTDGLLDRCHCGAVAGFDTTTAGGKERFMAGCTECCEQTVYRPFRFQVMREWNLARRAEKEKQK